MLPLPKRTLALLCVAAVAAMHVSRPITARAPTELRVHAGKHARQNAIVPVTLPRLESAAQSYELRGEAGQVIPVQIDRDGHGWFVLPSLDAGAERTYTIAVRSTATPAIPATVTVTRTESDLAIGIAGKDVLVYRGGAGRLPSADIKPAFQRGGYIHPVRTPSGRIVTDDYPADHRHQHGVMFAWTSAEFEGRKTDFWNMGSSLARVEAVAVDAVWNGVVHGGWSARHRYVDLTSGGPKPVLNEEWTTRVYATGAGAQAAHVFDVDVRQTTATATPLILPEYHYGGMAVRGAASFMGAPTNEIVVTSEGKDRTGADNSRARWAHISGIVDGSVAGIAMLGHPSNFRAPEPMRMHPTDPYMCFVPSRLGAWSITSERPYVARYRFVAADGPANATMLERLWNDYADPPRVTVR
ncbi:MAG: PmoA family protein [Vicinamibacterales bacterium]